MAALRALAEPFVQKGDYNEALRISHLALRIAEKRGDRTRIANACARSVISTGVATLRKKR